MVGVCTGPRVEVLCVPLVLLVPVLWPEVGVGCGGTLVEVLLPEFVLVGWWPVVDREGVGRTAVEAGSRQAPA